MSLSANKKTLIALSPFMLLFTAMGCMPNETEGNESASKKTGLIKVEVQALQDTCIKFSDKYIKPNCDALPINQFCNLKKDSKIVVNGLKRLSSSGDTNWFFQSIEELSNNSTAGASIGGTSNSEAKAWKKALRDKSSDKETKRGVACTESLLKAKLSTTMLAWLWSGHVKTTSKVNIPVHAPIKRISLNRIAKGAMTSGYGPRWGRMHRGIDVAAPKGTPISRCLFRHGRPCYKL